jgi:hypothetical protein
VFIASPAIVGMSTLDKSGIPLRSGSTSTISTFSFIIWRNQPWLSTINLGQHIQFHETSILARKSGHVECFIRKAVQIDLHPDNMNRKEGFLLSKSWRPVIKILNRGKKTLSKEMLHIPTCFNLLLRAI